MRTYLPQRISTPTQASAGFTVVELLITAFIFLVILGGIGSLLVAGTRTYEVTGERSELMQDSEAVLHLLRYEAAMAGYRGIEEDTFDRPFTIDGTDTLSIRSADDGDEITMRYFEDRYIAGSDTGERSVSFYVDDEESALVRRELRATGVATVELMAGSVSRMDILEVVDRDRNRVSVEEIISGAAIQPPDVAGVTMRITFTDGQSWEFMIGISNPQTYSVSAG